MTELIFYLTEIESREQDVQFISLFPLLNFFFFLAFYLFMKKHTNLDLFFF